MTKNGIDALVFIYNAQGGKLSAAMDIAHKIVSPKTYACDLCSLTHGVFNERKEWTAFKRRSQVALEFLHKDEWSRKNNSAFDYPVILRRSGEQYEVFMGSDEIALQSDVSMLIKSIEERLQKD